MSEKILLRSLEDTVRFGALLAQEISRLRLRTILCSGPLGSGKTTMIRALVESLPGSEQAQISSPSFSICNHYPVEPQVLHADLYRLTGDIPEELLESLEGEKEVSLVEWAEYMPIELIPQDALTVCFEIRGDERLLTLSTQGKKSRTALESILKDMHHCEKKEPQESDEHGVG